MTKLRLEKELADIAAAKEQIMANMNALIGAENVLKKFIKELDEDESPSLPEEPKLTHLRPSDGGVALLGDQSDP